MDARAIVFDRPGHAELQSCAVEAPKYGEVQIKMNYTVVSAGTEYAFLMGSVNTAGNFPRKLGYSASAEIIAIGDGVTGYKPGDRVIAYHGKHQSINNIPVDKVYPIPDGVSDTDAAFTEIACMKFYLMWANHDAGVLWDKRNSRDLDTVVWQGSVDRAEFERAMSRVIEKYFKLPNYYTIDGKPVFMIYDVPKLAEGLGGIEQTRDALNWFREACVKAGLKGLHLQFTMWNTSFTNLSGADGSKTVPAEKFGSLGFDSCSHYQYVHFADIDRDYADVLCDVEKEWKRLDASLPFPYFPHVSVGWDNNPRFIDFRPGVMKNCTPQNIEKALRMAKAYADSHPSQPPLITVNSWNEWTETSYLEPDDLYGYGYLDAVQKVFLNQD